MKSEKCNRNKNVYEEEISKRKEITKLKTEEEKWKRNKNDYEEYIKLEDGNKK